MTATSTKLLQIYLMPAVLLLLACHNSTLSDKNNAKRSSANIAMQDSLINDSIRRSEVSKVKHNTAATDEEEYERIKPLYTKIKTGQPITQQTVLPFAASFATRVVTFKLLASTNQLALFPSQYYSIEKGAEGYLANWLEYPTELDGCPSEMQLVKIVPIKFDTNKVFYYVFKFWIDAPHWASKDGWMLGVAGPYFADTKPYDFPHATFSRLSSKFGKVSPEAEAAWVHNNIALKKED